MSGSESSGRHLPTSGVFLGAMIALGAATLALALGPTPLAWLVRLGSFADLDAVGSVRVLAGTFASAALGALLIPRWSRRFARFGCALAAFAGVATASALLRSPGLILIGSLAVAAAAGWLTLALGPRESDDSVSRVSPAWRILAAIAVSTAGFTLAAASPIAQPRAEGPLIETRTYVRNPTETGNSIDLHLSRWQGTSLADTGVYRYLPELEALVPTDTDVTTYLVFYNVRCGHCHSFFDEHFALDVLDGVRVIAIEIPEPPDAHVLDSDQPDTINCPTCTRLALPSGPAWLISPPAVVRVERGVVTCANEPPGRVACVK